MLAAGTLTTAVGIAVAATAPVLGTAGAERTRPQELLGGVLVLVGWGLLAWAIHRFGRLGP
jgi:predicted MFS family arabinose efflux permease